MPTKLDRVQVLFQKDVFKKLKLLAKLERRSLSSMAGSLVEDAIESQKYQSLLSKAKSDDLKSKVDETKLLINDILRPNTDFDVSSKLKKIDNLLTLISKSNAHDKNKQLKSR
jgi:mRNA-degrading endonuclease RelE of RelBE toxin-antitoxin system